MRLIRLLKNDLAQESATWVEQGLISRSQAESICALYGADYDAAARGARGQRVLVVLGYAFLGLALITLLSANWDNLPRALRMGSLVGLTAVLNGYALWLYRGERDRAAEGVFFLGGLAYGASIILIAQIYHLGEHMPDGVLWWALGTAPAALLLQSPVLALLSVLLALVWFLIELQLGFFAPGLAFFLALGGYVLYAGRRSVLLFLLVVAGTGLLLEVALGVWWSNQALVMRFRAEQFPVGVGYFILAYALSHLLYAQPSTKARDYGTVLSLWTLRFALVCAFILSYNDVWVAALKAHWTEQQDMWAVLCVVCGGALVCAWRARKLLPVLALCIALFVVTAAVANGDNIEHAIYWQVLANLTVACFGLGLIVRGVQHGESQSYFLGVATVLLLALLRYIDLIGDYVGTAVLFVVIAVVLLGAARYWQRRHAAGSQA